MYLSFSSSLDMLWIEWTCKIDVDGLMLYLVFETRRDEEGKKWRSKKRRRKEKRSRVRRGKEREENNNMSNDVISSSWWWEFRGKPSSRTSMHSSLFYKVQWESQGFDSSDLPSLRQTEKEKEKKKSREDRDDEVRVHAKGKRDAVAII